MKKRFESDQLLQVRGTHEQVETYFEETESEPADIELNADSDDLVFSFTAEASDELQIHHQNAAVLTPEELTLQAQQLDQSRFNLTRLLIHSDQGLRVLAGEFIRSINDGVDISELISNSTLSCLSI